MEIKQFFVAYSHRKDAMPEDIRVCCDTYEEAKYVADDFLCDDDDSRVWIQVDNVWYCVFGRDKYSQALIVSKEEINCHKAYVSEWY